MFIFRWPSVHFAPKNSSAHPEAFPDALNTVFLYISFTIVEHHGERRHRDSTTGLSVWPTPSVPMHGQVADAIYTVCCGHRAYAQSAAGAVLQNGKADVWAAASTAGRK
jgi:hypothetical protein